MRSRLLLAVALAMPAVAFAWPWSTDMMNQPSIKPQEGQMKSFPMRSVPVQGIPTTYKNRDETKMVKNPIPATEESVQKGRTLFRIYCAACHGLKGMAESPVSSKIGAISLADDYVQKQLTEGWVFGTITFGSYVMPAYGVPEAREDKRGSNDLSVEERWHVVNYVKNGLLKEQQEPAARSAAK